jgi:hypothetical protein
LGHNVFSNVEVDAVMARATSAGAIIVKPAHDTFRGGYSGYFQDASFTRGTTVCVRFSQVKPLCTLNLRLEIEITIIR